MSLLLSRWNPGIGVVLDCTDLCTHAYFYCDSLKYICKTIENVNSIADNSLQKAFKHKLGHSCTYILVDICED